METLKKNLIWLVILVILAAASLVLYFMTADVEGELTKAKSELQDMETQLRGRFSKPGEDPPVADKVLTSHHVKAAREFGANLGRQEKAFEARFKEEGLELGKQPPFAPPRCTYSFEQGKSLDSVAFQAIWMQQMREAVLTEARDNHLKLDEKFAKENLFEGEARDLPPNSPQRLERVYRVAIAAQMVNLLANLRGRLTRLRPSSEAASPAPVPVEEEVAVVSLQKLRIAMNEDRLKEEADALSDAQKHCETKEAGPKPPPGKAAAAPPQFFSGFSVELRFTAVAPLIPQVLQVLENGPPREDERFRLRYLGVLRKLDTQRAGEAFPAFTEKYEPRPDHAASKANTYFREAPIEVLALLDLLEFKESK